MRFANDEEMFQLMEQKLYSAVLSDSLDKIGLTNQAMRADIRPVYAAAVVCGRAFTALSVDVYEVYEDPYQKEIESVDSLKPGDVMVAATGRSTRTAFWGELLSTAAKARGARGAIIDGYTRDVRRITEMGFPVFVTGTKPVDSAGRGYVMEFGRPVSCGDVVVKEGDIVFGDVDGIVSIPRKAQEEVVSRALEKVSKENQTRIELQRGAYLRDVYAKYGTL
jgi:regulator of RNase E activity RraA